MEKVVLTFEGTIEDLKKFAENFGRVRQKEIIAAEEPPQAVNLDFYVHDSKVLPPIINDFWVEVSGKILKAGDNIIWIRTENTNETFPVSVTNRQLFETLQKQKPLTELSFKAKLKTAGIKYTLEIWDVAENEVTIYQTKEVEF